MKLPWRVPLGVLAVIAVVAIGILPFRPTPTVNRGTTTPPFGVLQLAMEKTIRGDQLDTPLLRRFFTKYGENGPTRNTATKDADLGNSIVDSFLATRRHPCSTTGLSMGEDHQTIELKYPEIIRNKSSGKENSSPTDGVPSQFIVSSSLKAHDLNRNSVEEVIDPRPSPEKPEEPTEVLNSPDRILWSPSEKQKGQNGNPLLTEARELFTSSKSKATWREYHALGPPNTIMSDNRNAERRTPTSTHVIQQACDVTGVVTVQDGGRLGNKLWEYAAVWALGKLLKLRPLVPKSILRHLGRYFKDLSVPALEDYFPGNCSASPESLGEPMKRWRVLPLSSLLQRLNHSSRRNLVLHRWIVLPEPIIAFRGKPIQEEFRFHPRLVKKAEITLNWVTNKVNNIRISKNCSTSDVTFIGVHVRRTDFAQWLPRVYNKSLATAFYFRQAMDYFRKKIDGPLAFIVVSDDTEWVKMNLGAKEKGSIDKTHPGLNDVFLGTNNKDLSSDGVGHDLALLSRCNHTIIDYGTFGSWGALMTSGETISLRLDKHLDYVLKKHIPGWMLWNDPGI